MSQSAFADLANRYFEASFRRSPTWATALGRHDLDDRLEDYSLAAAAEEADELRAFHAQFSVETEGLSPAEAADRTWLLASIDGRLQELEVFRPLETDPDRYSSGLTHAAFSLINRDFAPATVRLKALLARMRAMPAVLELARVQLKNPPAVATEIALDQLAGNRSFFTDTVAAAFDEVENPDLLRALRHSCAVLDDALARYGQFLEDDLLPRSTGEFAIGATEYARKLRADELIDVPLEKLLAIGEADLAANQAAMEAACREIDPDATTAEVLARLGATHVAKEELLETTQAMLGEIVTFLEDRALVTLPPGPPLRVVETPPFMRATTTAAMDTPGPFEEAGTDAYYYMTLPNPAWLPEEQEAYMQQWSRSLIANLSVHEAYPGHYIQFLLTAKFPTATRRILWSPSNAEGWAHYCEQMMVEEGFRADDPWYRIAQLQDALLRNVRVVVGIGLHTGRMTVDEAIATFEREARLSAQGAKAEAWRGTMDPTYGYYTLGKLMLAKLRRDVEAAQGASFSLKAFHDDFLALGPIPLPLVRQAMLGAVGDAL
ncbi:hypothetical protein D3C72_662760 [compost metagenome]